MAISGGTQDVQQVCRNGHQITDSLHGAPHRGRKHCEKCGAPTISKCEACGTNILGKYHLHGVIGGSSASVPEFCVHCGTPFPWAGKKNAAELAKNQWGAPMGTVEALCEKFHTVARQLRERHGGRGTIDVSDEYDVQDLLHSLLRIFFDDVRPEEWAPSFAGASSRMDFLLKKEQIVVEVKRSRATLGAKEVGEELLADIARYSAHPDCKTLVCFVYDPEGRVRNPRAVEKDLETRSTKSMAVRVFVRPT
jgi:hypothetical protein